MDNFNKLYSIIRNTDLLNNEEKIDLHLYLFNLNEQVKKYKEVIDKLNKYLHTRAIKKCYNGTNYCGFDGLQAKVFEDILKEVE